MTELELEILKGQLIYRLVAVTDASGTHMSIFLTIIRCIQEEQNRMMLPWELIQ